MILVLLFFKLYHGKEIVTVSIICRVFYKFINCFITFIASTDISTLRNRIQSNSMTSTTCTTAQQKQCADYSSSQHIIQSDEQPSKQVVGEVLKVPTASNASCHLPAPAFFCRKATSLERTASLDKTKITEPSMDAQRKSFYLAHRQYIHSLIIQTETFVESSPHDLWDSCESLFEMN